MDFDWFLATMRKGTIWREGRKLLDRSLRPGATMEYRQMMQENIHGFLARLLAAPKEFRRHISLSVISLPYIILPLTAMQPSGKTCHVPHIRL
jgi:hypothetical protein